MALKLTVATGPYDRVRAFHTGAVRMEGAEIRYVPVKSPPDLFTRMVRDGEFDAAEMSLGFYLPARAERQLPFVAIPVFPSRVFRHSFIFVNTRAGIATPKDLEGKRIGVRGYRQTAGVWIRGILRDEYGVSLDRVRWVEGGVNAPRKRETTLDIRPDGSGPSIEFAPDDRSLNDMLADGEIDALVGAELPHTLATSPNVARLFPDYRAVEREYFTRTGLYPTMHTVVIREELHRRHPWIAESLYKAFEEAKAWAHVQNRFMGALHYMLPWLSEQMEEIDRVFGGDPFPYGLEANRKPLETMMRYLVADGFLTRTVAIDDLFVPIIAQAHAARR